MMKHLLELKSALKIAQKQNPIPVNYYIPDIWDAAKLQLSTNENKTGLIKVNPYQFLEQTIDWILAQKLPTKLDYLRPYYDNHPLKATERNGNWLKNKIIYSLLIRTSTAFDHDQNGHLELCNTSGFKETGTFVKTLALLPFLKLLGVQVIYLLPIFKTSKTNKKGEAGSPYAVADFFQLDADLADPIVGPDFSIEQQFKALIEACHLLDIKVTIDIIPRTSSIDSDYLISHPEWFYWLKKADLTQYQPPIVADLKGPVVAEKSHFPALFSAPTTQTFLKLFQPDPKTLNPTKWQQLVDQYQANPTYSPLKLYEEIFGLTVASAFSDNINDPQPVWSDVTYWRLFLDHPKNSTPYLKRYRLTPAPYLLFDVAKSSLNPGLLPNWPLWELLSDILPFYQTNYGIDGARIDMGHALPKQLNALIIQKARQVNPNFALIAEELNPYNAKIVKKQGYQVVIGNGFVQIPYLASFGLHEFFYQSKYFALPILVGGETHDTPRLAAFPGGFAVAYLITLLSYFTVNGVPFINSGQELGETSPMNLGLGFNDPSLIPVASKKQPTIKLALFDYVAFDYTWLYRWNMALGINDVLKWRKKYLSALYRPNQSYYLNFDHMRIPALGVALTRQKSLLLVVAHTEQQHANDITLHLANLPAKFLKQPKITLVYSNKKTAGSTFDLNDSLLTIKFEPTEFMLIEFIIP